MSAIIGLYFWKCNINSIIIWTYVFTFGTINEHCNIIKNKNQKKHDYHHLLNNVNYGSGFNFMDKLFNTFKE